MSSYLIDDLNAVARVRLGRTTQVRALARRTARPPLERYLPLRDPYAHAFVPGLDHRTGKLTPQQAAIAEALAGLPDNIREQALRALRVPAAAARAAAGGGVRAGRARAPIRPTPPSSAKPTAPEVAYTIRDTGGIHSTDLTLLSDAADQGFRTQRSIPLAKPMLVTGIAWQNDSTSAGAISWTIAIPEIGFNHSHAAIPGGGTSQDSHSLPCYLLALDGITVDLAAEYVDDNPAVNVDTVLTAHISYRDVDVARRRERAAASTEATGPVSPYVQLSDEVLGALEAAGVPPAWYEIAA